MHTCAHPAPKSTSVLLLALSLIAPVAQSADKQMQDCTDLALSCASTATPHFAPDHGLWVAWTAAGSTLRVARSADLGKTFSAPVSVNPAPQRLDGGPDARATLAVDADNRVFVAYTVLKDQQYNGQALYSRSSDGGRSFETPHALTGDAASQRFETIAVDPQGRLFAAWIDKRGRDAAKLAQKPYEGAALAYAWSDDHGTTFSPASLAHEHTCECCRIGVGMTAKGMPVVLFRSLYPGSVRDHAVLTFDGRTQPGQPLRVSEDNWQTQACPHHGPSLSVADGRYHVAWFTAATDRKGLYYAQSQDGGRHFTLPMAFGESKQNPTRPYVLARGKHVWLAWKEFDGKQSRVRVMHSDDEGAHWSTPVTRAETGGGSDHPILAADGAHAYLSWLTRAEGYRLLPLNTP